MLQAVHRTGRAAAAAENVPVGRLLAIHRSGHDLRVASAFSAGPPADDGGISFHEGLVRRRDMSLVGIDEIGFAIEGGQQGLRWYDAKLIVALRRLEHGIFAAAVPPLNRMKEAVFIGSRV